MTAVSTRPDDDDTDDDLMPDFFESVGSTMIEAAGGTEKLIKTLIVLMSGILVSNLLVVMVLLYMATHQLY